MAKTGERYTAARLQVVGRNGHAPESTPEASAVPAEPGAPGPGATLAPAPASPFRAGAGASDAALIKRTGNTWEHWFRILDAWGGADRPHGEIARYLHGEHGVEGWWAQELTVRYEMAIGRRVPGQRPDGFEVTASKTVAVSVDRLLDAWIDEGERAAWLHVPLRLRGVNRGRTLTARFDWTDPAQRIVVWCTAKGARSTMALAHQKIPDVETAAQHKAFWKAAVAALARYLEQQR